MDQSLHVGIGRTDITPPLGTLLMGYPVPDRRAESVRDPLHVTALAFVRGDQRAAVLSLDVGILDDPEVDAIRQGVAACTGIPAPHVTVCAIQTHSAPCTQEAWGWCEKDRPYIDFMVERAIAAATAAHAALQPARVGIGVAQSDVGVNRRQIREDHTVALGVNPWGPYDPEMTVVRFEGAHGPLATLIHYGAHGTVLSSSSRCISRDWPGVMIDRVEGLTGAPALFINGAVGDVAPRSNYLSAVGDGEMALMEVGGRAAMDAMRAYRATKEWRDLSLATITGEIVLPYRPLPPLEEAQRQLALAAPRREQYGAGMCEYKHWQAVIDAHAQAPRAGKVYMQTITRLGPLALVPFPGEPFAEIVLRLRHASPFAYTLCASTSCGNNGYFVTRESLHRGGYENWVGKALGAYLLADGIDDVLVESNLKLLRALMGDGELAS